MDELTLQLFDDYLEGILDENTKTSFESRLQKEPETAAAFETYKEINGMLSHTYSMERSAFQETLQQASSEHFNAVRKEDKSPKVIRFRPWKYAVAACVVLLIGGILLTNNSTPSYDSYAFDGKISIVQRGSDESAFAKAEIAFNNRQFQEAITHLDAVLEEDPENVEVQYYKGIALVETDQFTAAEIVFQKLRSGNSLYKHQATWYLALSNLKQEKLEQTRALLQTIPAMAEVYEQAQKLLKKLD